MRLVFEKVNVNVMENIVKLQYDQGITCEIVAKLKLSSTKLLKLTKAGGNPDCAGFPMGLTVHYTLTFAGQSKSEEIRALVERAHALTQRAAVASVAPVLEIEPDFPLAHEWVLGEGESDDERTFADVPPQIGYAFSVGLGRDCENMLLGLCRYPSEIKSQGRKLPTRVGDKWRLHHACKTQYAGLHGWDYFLKCHQTVFELLGIWRELGVGVEINDEGGYWPDRSEEELRRRLDEMNGITAALSGAIKDNSAGLKVEAPILQHPDFERLEAEGEQRYGDKVRKVVRAVKRAIRRK